MAFPATLDQARKAHAGVDLVPLVNVDFDTTRQTLDGAPEGAVALRLPGSWLLPTGEFLAGQASRDLVATTAPLPYLAITRDSFGSGLVSGAFSNRE